jgi:hypothetical protein
MPCIEIITSSDDAATFATRVAETIACLPTKRGTTIEPSIIITNKTTTHDIKAAAQASTADLIVLLGHWNAVEEVITLQLERDLTRPVNIPLGRACSELGEYFPFAEEGEEEDSGSDDEEEDEGPHGEDYPFTSWWSFKPALLESMTTEYYGEMYPKYQAAIDSGETDDLIEIKKLATTENADEILGDYIDMICGEGYRYGPQMDWPKIIRHLMRLGAEFPIASLFSFEYNNEIEDIIDTGNIDFRAEIIDYFAPKFKDIKAPSWVKAIEPQEYNQDDYEEGEDIDVDEVAGKHLMTVSRWLRQQARARA